MISALTAYLPYVGATVPLQ